MLCSREIIIIKNKIYNVIDKLKAIKCSDFLFIFAGAFLISPAHDSLTNQVDNSASDGFSQHVVYSTGN